MIYNESIEKAAYSIFLNFYRAEAGLSLIDEKDTLEIIKMISSYYSKQPLTVEKDIRTQINLIMANIPNQYLTPDNKIILH